MSLLFQSALLDVLKDLEEFFSPDLVPVRGKLFLGASFKGMFSESAVDHSIIGGIDKRVALVKVTLIGICLFWLSNIELISNRDSHKWNQASDSLL